MKIDVSRNPHETVVQANFRRCLDRLDWFGLTGRAWFQLRHAPENLNKSTFRYDSDGCFLYDSIDFFGYYTETYVAVSGEDVDVEFYVPKDFPEVATRQLETLAWNAGATFVKFLDVP